MGALPVWRRFVEAFTGGTVRGAFRRPADVERAEIEPSTGALAFAGCPDHRPELFLAGTLPDDTCPAGRRGVANTHGDDSPGVRHRFFDWLRRQM